MGFVADNPTPTPQKRGRFVPDGEPAAPGASFGDTLLGEGEVLGTGLVNALPAAANSLTNIISRATGFGDQPPPIKTMHVGEAGKRLLNNLTPDNLDISDEELRQLDPSGKVPIEQLRAQYKAERDKPLSETLADSGTVGGDVASNLVKTGGDVGNIAGAASLVGGAADLPNTLRNAVESSPTVQAVRKAHGILSPPEAIPPVQPGDMESALTAIGYRNLPRQGGGTTMENVGADIAGEPPVAGAQTLNNQAVTTAVGKHESGVPQTNDLDYASLAKARKGPTMGQAYDTTKAALPDTLAQDPELQAKIGGIGDTASQLPRSPDVEGLKQHMLNQPTMTKDELFANIAQARDKASRFYASDEPDAHAIGDAYQGVADAYEDFVGRQLGNDPAALKAWQDARKAFAKNYAVQSAVVGKDMDAGKLATLQRKDPTRLDGGLQLVAEQQNRYPLSTGFGPRTFQPGGIGASGTPQGIIARHVTGPAVGAGVGTLIGGPVGGVVGGASGLLASEAFQSMIRRALGGNPAASARQAVESLTGPTLADFLEGAKEPEPPFDLKAPPGRAFTPNQPQLATGSPSRSFFGTGADAVPPAGPMGAAPTGGGPGGQIPLFDLLSHGVESEPAAGLTASAPQAPAAPGGIPFSPNLEHASGGLSLSDLLEGKTPENNTDLAAVKSARIPDKTKGAARTLPKDEPTPGSGSVDLPTRPGLTDDQLSLAHEPTLMELLENLRDHPDVMSQGVPEGIMTRTNPVVERGGSDTASVKAASPEAMNRGTRNVIEISPDGRASPVLKDVTQIDAKAKQGHILADADTNEIIDRGGLPRGHAQGLLNRYLSIHARPSLMDEFER